MGPGDLRRMLGGWAPTEDDRVLLDATHADDAGAVRLASGRLLLHTVDVITPIVDDPETFGQVAAANAVSDIYAMGGRPTSAVSILGVPKELPPEIIVEVLGGARRLLSDCGAFLVGGHTLKDRELKLGFAVTGEGDEDSITTHRGARPGDRLVLTKPLGTGILHQAAKKSPLNEGVEQAWWASMARSNRSPADQFRALGVRAATDVTGFGLAGHALNLARGSGVDLLIRPDRLPTLTGVSDFLAQGLATGAGTTNFETYAPDLETDGVPAELQTLIADPQTSGGLLFALPPGREAELDPAQTWVIGEVREPKAARPMVRFVA